MGRSVQGRPLSLVTAARPEALARDAPCVLVICGQHGNEPTSTRAALAVLRRLARSTSAPPVAGTDPASSGARSAAGLAPQAPPRPSDPQADAILSRVVTLVVPSANPDGAARHTRANARGVDLNRDWQERTQPETRAVFDAVTRCQPDLVIDAHEWAPGDVHTTSTVELPLLPGRAQGEAGFRPLARWVSLTLGGCRRHGVYVGRTHWTPASDPRLAHRYLTSAWGIPAVLYETMPAGAAPPAARVSDATRFLWELLGAFAASAASAPIAPPPAPSPPSPSWPTPAILALCVLLVLLAPYGRVRCPPDAPRRHTARLAPGRRRLGHDSARPAPRSPAPAAAARCRLDARPPTAASDRAPRHRNDSRYSRALPGK